MTEPVGAALASGLMGLLSTRFADAAGYTAASLHGNFGFVGEGNVPRWLKNGSVRFDPMTEAGRAA